MRVFVTGAGGFVGGRLLPRLERAGCRVTAADLELDVTDGAAIHEAFERARPERVIHLAAQSSVADSWRDPALTYRVNYLGTRNVLHALERVAPAARLLLVGSGDQYSPMEAGSHPLRECDPLRPRSPYARSKTAAEQLAGFAAERGLDVVRIRAFPHTGAGQGTRFVASDFARQVARIAAGRQPPSMRVGNLDSVRDFLHVEDVLDAYLRLLERSVPAGIYNVASGVGTPIRALLETLFRLAGVSPAVQVAPERFRATDSMVGDASRLRQATGWRPRIALRETLQELLDFWRDAPDPPGSGAEHAG